MTAADDNHEGETPTEDDTPAEVDTPAEDETHAEDGTLAEDEPLDQLGIPMSREPTIDDVRSDGRAHRGMALGCTVLVTLFVIGFWLVRVVMLG